ncbi:hypothetical protein [Micromonospora sp. NPDC049799]|uniref:hypothetical protein n=1 Tax=Micromonospora sp. NPDC049799 TaxID=3154741 RepID=UPI0033F132EA
MNTELRYVLLGALLSIPLSILSPFATEWIKQRLAHRSSKAGIRRHLELKRELERIESWHADKQAFSMYLVSRVVLVWLIESVASIVGNAVGAGNNSLWLVELASQGTLDRLRFPMYLGDAISSTIWFVISVAIFTILYTAYRNYRNVRDIDRVRAKYAALVSSLPPLAERGDEEEPTRMLPRQAGPGDAGPGNEPADTMPSPTTTTDSKG